MNIYIILPFLAGVVIALGNFFMKQLAVQFSFDSPKIFLIIRPIITGVIGFLLVMISYRKIDLWQVVITISSVATVTSVLLGVFLLHENISLLKSFLVLVVIISIGIIAITTQGV